MGRKLLLLGLLRRQDMHGYQLNEFIETSLATCVDIKKPTAYYLLNKMQEDGWITDEEDQEGNRPMRRVYSITAQGEAAFQQLLRENLASYVPAQFTNDIGLAFIDEVSPQEALPLLARRRQALEAQLAAVQATPDHPGSLHLMIEHQIRHLTAEQQWLDEVITRIEQTGS